MKKLASFVAVCLLFLPLTSISSISVSIFVKDTFNLGESISFNYSLTSTDHLKVTYMSHVSCPNIPQAMLTPKNLSLFPNEPFVNQHTDITIDDTIEPQSCNAIVQILSPIQMTDQKAFTINTPPSFLFEVYTCKDASCLEKSKVFVKGDTIYLGYGANVSNPSAVLQLAYPDQSIELLNLPTSIEAEQLGTYTLEVNASKEGYKTKTASIQFGVIEKPANVPLTGLCSKDGVCTPICSPEDKDCASILSYLPYIVAIVITIALIILILAIKKRKSAPPVFPPQQI